MASSSSAAGAGAGASAMVAAVLRCCCGETAVLQWRLRCAGRGARLLLRRGSVDLTYTENAKAPVRLLSAQSQFLARFLQEPLTETSMSIR